MLRGRRAGIAAAFALAAVAVATTGCGGGGGALAFDPVAAAATKSQNAGAAHVRFALAVNGQGRTVKLNGSGVVDGASGELNVDISGPAAANASLKEIFLKEGDDFVTYVRAGFLASRLPAGKQWAKLDLSTLGKSAGIDFSQLLSGSQLQPTDLLSMLKTEGATVRKVAAATVDGTPTTHYHVTVDTAKALESYGLTSPALAVIAAEVPSIPEDVWIGKDGLVHRIKVAFGFQAQGKPVQVALATDLYDYGTDVTIAAPPSSDVFDATQLAQKSLGSALNH